MSANPLSKYFRKPTTYIQLPSRGIFNPEIKQSMIDEVGILPMTALDELELRNPDALLNGEALVTIIKSCVPSIPDPTKLPNIDVEALFLAIRYATYGSQTTHSHTCTNCNETSDYNIDINYILSKFPTIDKQPIIEYNGLKVYIRPNTLESVTRVAFIEAEQLKMIEYYASPEFKSDAVENSVKKIYDSFHRIATHNVDLISDAIAKIEMEDGVFVEDRNFISEFVRNIPKDVADNIKSKVQKISNKPKDIGKMEFTCAECGHNEEVNIEFNPVNFSEAG